MRSIVLALSLICWVRAPVVAGESADMTRAVLAGGRLEAGENALSARVASEPLNNEARFGLGMVRFARSLEHFGKRQYQHGFHAPNSPMIPVLRLPVPLNAEPEPLSYDSQRESLQELLNDLGKVEDTLAAMTDAPTALVIDLDAVRFDFRGDGKPDKTETLGEILARLGGDASPARYSAAEKFEVKFDNGDAFWLRGYCQLLSAALEFVLAYDWRNTFSQAGGLFYPRLDPPAFPAGHPLAAPSAGMLGDDAQIADMIVFLHEIRWPLKEPARLQAAHVHLKRVIAMSRASWKAILAESDDDREWIPGPRQKNGVITGLTVTQQQVDGWLKALDDFDAVLDGRKLAPHWRFVQGVNVKRAFLEPRDFDLVLWLAGHAAVPYLQDGAKLSSAEWDEWNRAFHNNFLGYAFWFN